MIHVFRAILCGAVLVAASSTILIHQEYYLCELLLNFLTSTCISVIHFFELFFMLVLFEFLFFIRNLSSSELTGEITSNIADLTVLRVLYVFLLIFL